MIIYIDHSYHQHTNSTRFFPALLEEEHDVQLLWDESWRDEAASTDDLVDEINRFDVDAVVFFQVIPSASALKRLKCSNRIWIPMRDGVDLNPKWMRRYRKSGLRIINFCRESHEFFSALKIPSLSVKYFPKPSSFHPEAGGSDAKKLQALFWVRRPEIAGDTFSALTKSMSDFHCRLLLRPDPGVTLPEFPQTLPNASVELITEWLSDEDYQSLLARSDIYFAPRVLEGIGMSYLEAMAAGACVVAPNRPTMNEYIEHGLNGVLYDEDNPRPLELDKLSVRRMGVNASLYVRDGYSRWQTDRERILRFVTGPDRRTWWSRISG